MDFKEKIKEQFAEYKVVDAEEDGDWFLYKGETGVIVNVNDYYLGVTHSEETGYKAFFESYSDNVDRYYICEDSRSLEEIILCVKKAINELL